VRRDNQDSGYAGPYLLAVADGVGGAARGDIASSTAIQQLRSLDTPPGNDMLERLAGAVHLIHNRLADLVTENPEIDGTSTTVTAAVFEGDRLGMAHVGDSRAYLLRDGEIRRLTTDHTFVQSLIDEGRITEEEARVHPHRNLILRAVDGVHEPEPDTFVVDLREGDRLLFCSDGCCGSLDDTELGRLLGIGDVEAVAPALVSASLEAGSSDNVTVVVADVIDLEGVEADAPAPAPLIVGAAAGDARPHTGRIPLLRRRSAEPEDDLDPETLRYAPRPPRRFAWLRRAAALLILLLLLAVVGGVAYSWSQTQYFVGTSAGHVAIYRGIEADLPGIKLHTLVERTGVLVDDLPDHNARQVRAGMSASSRSRAEDIASNLHDIVCPTPTPTPSPTKKPSPKPSAKAGTKSKRPSPRPSRSATPSPTPTPASCQGSAS
jgi:protein phosphatase